MKLILRGLAISGALLIAVGTAVPAYASPNTTEGISESSTNAPEQLQYRQELDALIGKQDRHEITAFARSDVPKEILVDPNSGEILAAIPVSKTDQSRISNYASTVAKASGLQQKITCSSTTLCMYKGTGGKYAYGGVGVLYGTWSGIYRVESGDRLTSFKWNGNLNVFGPNTGATLLQQPTITRIARGSYQ